MKYRQPQLLLLVCGLLHQPVASAVETELPADGLAIVERTDALIADAWRREGANPVAKSGDAEFLRRVWLDLAGVAPPVAVVRRFLAEESPNKRLAEIDWLLNSPRHASHMAGVWQNILLPEGPPQGMENTAAGLREWLRNQFLDNVGYDHFVASFLTAGGEAANGPAAFYTSLQVEPKKLASATSQIFLGQQLKCAECHDHPFDRWSQQDFWAFTAFFAQLSQRTSGGKTYVEDSGSGDVTIPETATVVEPAYPGGQLPEWDPDGNRRRQLTIWMASRDNPYLPRAIVNRVWAHLFGRGQVEPIDAMDLKNPAAHPELLDALVENFVANRFDLRRLFRVLMQTEAYQLTSEAASDHAAEVRPELFAKMNVKTLSSEQFYDTLVQNVIRRPAQMQTGMNAGIDPLRTPFIQRMRSIGASPREYPHGVVQALGLMNGPEVGQGVRFESSGLLQSLDAPFFDDVARIETLFLATLSRPPTSQESKRFMEHLASGKRSAGKSTGMSDMLWALVNSSEFATCP